MVYTSPFCPERMTFWLIRFGLQGISHPSARRAAHFTAICACQHLPAAVVEHPEVADRVSEAGGAKKGVRQQGPQWATSPANVACNSKQPDAHQADFVTRTSS